MTRFGSISTDSDKVIVENPSVTDADLATQTITTASILGITVSTGDSTQTAITNIVNDLNDLKAKLRTIGILGT
jgi:hypothetical protein